MMGLLRKNENKLRTWVADFSPTCMKLYLEFRAIEHHCNVEFNGDWGYEVSDGEGRHTINLEQKKCTCRIWDLSGIPCPHAIKALTHKKVDPKTEIHWWYSKEAYMLTYKQKIQPVRGQMFWKVNPSNAMLPPDVVKQVGRPKVKRNREPDEASKRKGEWSQSRKGTQMTCSNCGEPNHNKKGCYKEKSAENNAYSKKELTSTSSQSRKMGSEYETQTGTQESTFQPQAATQEFEPYDPDVGNEEDPPLKIMVICESDLRTEKLKTRIVSTGTKNI
ncbi:uncharacterized protein LOC129882009 [Solanum dulcamara]|uniref:uncharacterized protein LOC129882009 n=1 Tax=Solanum dulcamara TaxID=45834 RepID=UPI002485490B|nr:uncharacterized protein LOC129882009 [Solanum dulcamara]